MPAMSLIFQGKETSLGNEFFFRQDIWELKAIVEYVLSSILFAFAYNIISKINHFNMTLVNLSFIFVHH